MWSAYLGVDIEQHDVAAMMALLKVSRIRWSPTKRDHWQDLAGYAACGWDCVDGYDEAPAAPKAAMTHTCDHCGEDVRASYLYWRHVDTGLFVCAGAETGATVNGSEWVTA